MKNWAILFLMLGLVAGLLAFTGASSGVWTFILVAAFFVLLLNGLMLLLGSPRGRRPQLKS